jgi:shikimate kinase
MTSGKSTIGKMIQDRIGLKWIDLDQEIEKTEKKSINQIFQEKGEIYFRKKEREVLLELLKINNQIISVGGGTPCYYNNIDEINQSALSFYLRASVSVLTQRIKEFGATRPLVKDRTDNELKEFVAKHLFERNLFYEKAKFIVDTDHKFFEEITQEIITLTNIKL